MHKDATGGAAAQAAAAQRAAAGEAEEDEDAPRGAALPAAVHATLQLLEGAPGSLVLLSGSGATAGPGKTKRGAPKSPGSNPTNGRSAAASGGAPARAPRLRSAARAARVGGGGGDAGREPRAAHEA